MANVMQHFMKRLRNNIQQPLVRRQMRSIPDHHAPVTLELLGELGHRLQLFPVGKPRTSRILTSRRTHENLDVLILRGRVRPLVPLLEVKTLRVAFLERIQAALGVVVELHEDRVQRHIVENITDILVREGTLRCGSEVEVLPGLGLRGFAGLVHEIAEVVGEDIHFRCRALKVEVESVHHGVSEGAILRARGFRTEGLPQRLSALGGL